MSFINFIEEKLHLADPQTLSEEHPLGHELDKYAETDAHGFKGFIESLGTWAKGHPGKILTVLHALRPVLTIKNITVVSGYEGVKDVFGRDQDFNVTYGPKMKMITEGAGFFLGMDDDSCKGFSDRTNMQMLFRRDDVEKLVSPLIDELCQAALAPLQPGFDLVADYLTPVPARFAIQYFGFQEVEPARLHTLTAGLFDYLFIDVANTPEITAQAEKFAAELRALLDKEISMDSAPAESVLGRGLALHKANVKGFDPVNLRNNMIGLLIGLVPTTAKSAAMAFDFATADRDSAENFDKFFAANNYAACQAYVRELTRLNPINPGLFRQAARDTVVTSEGKRYKVPKDNLVFVSTYTAMRDKRHVEDPHAVKPGRPDSIYLTYGFGMHACFGRYINDLHVAKLLFHAYQTGYLHRADGPEGNLVFDGAFPSSLKLKTL